MRFERHFETKGQMDGHRSVPSPAPDVMHTPHAAAVRVLQTTPHLRGSRDLSPSRQTQVCGPTLTCLLGSELPWPRCQAWGVRLKRSPWELLMEMLLHSLKKSNATQGSFGVGGVSQSAV